MPPVSAAARAVSKTAGALPPAEPYVLTNEALAEYERLWNEDHKKPAASAPPAPAATTPTTAPAPEPKPPTVTNEQLYEYEQVVPKEDVVRAKVAATPGATRRVYTPLLLSTLSEWERAERPWLVDPLGGGMSEKQADDALARARTQLMTVEGYGNQPDAPEGWGRRLLRKGTVTVGKVAGRDSLPAQTMQAVSPRELLHGPETPIGDKAESDEGFYREGGVEVDYLNRVLPEEPEKRAQDDLITIPEDASLATQMLAGQTAGKTPQQAEIGDPGEAATAARRAGIEPPKVISGVGEGLLGEEGVGAQSRLPMSETERQVYKEQYEQALQQIRDAAAMEIGFLRDRRAKGEFDDRELLAKVKKVKEDEAAKIKATKEGAPSVVRELLGALTEGLETTAKTLGSRPLDLINPLAQAQRAFTDLPAVAGHLERAVSAAGPEAKVLAEEFRTRHAAAKKRKEEKFEGHPVLHAAHQVLWRPGLEAAVEVGGMHALQGIMQQTEGGMVETPALQIMRVAGNAAPSPFVVKFGRAAAGAGYSIRGLIPVDALPLYVPGNDQVGTAPRVYRFVTDLVDPRPLFQKRFWLDALNEWKTNRGMMDEMGDIARVALADDPTGSAARWMVAGGLVADVLFPWEKAALAHLSIPTVNVPRGVKAARRELRAGATGSEAAVVGMAVAGVPGAKKAAAASAKETAKAGPAGTPMPGAESYGEPDIHSVIVDHEIIGTGRRSAETGTIELPAHIQIRVNQLLTAEGIDPPDGEAAFIGAVGGPDVFRGPNQKRWESAYWSAAKSHDVPRREAEFVLKAKQNAAKTAVENGQYATIDDYYKGEIASARKFDKKRVAPGTLYQGAPPRPSPVESTEAQQALFQMEQEARTPEFQQWSRGLPIVEAGDELPPGGAVVRAYHSTNADISEFQPVSHFGTADAANERAEALGRFDGMVGRERAYQAMPVFVRLEHPLRLDDMGGIYRTDRGEFLDLYQTENRLDEFYQDDPGNPEMPHPVGWAEDGLDNEDFVAYLLDKDIITKDEFWEYQYKPEKVYDLLKEKGYDGIVYRNDIEDAGKDSYIVFGPTQVKSTFNRGTFSETDPRVLFQEGPPAGKGPMTRQAARAQAASRPTAATPPRDPLDPMYEAFDQVSEGYLGASKELDRFDDPALRPDFEAPLARLAQMLWNLGYRLTNDPKRNRGTQVSRQAIENALNYVRGVIPERKTQEMVRTRDFPLAEDYAKLQDVTRERQEAELAATDPNATLPPDYVRAPMERREVVRPAGRHFPKTSNFSVFNQKAVTDEVKAEQKALRIGKEEINPAVEDLDPESALWSQFVAARDYATRIRKIAVYNELQKLVKDANLSLGKLDFVEVEKALQRLLDYADEGDEAWQARALDPGDWKPTEEDLSVLFQGGEPVEEAAAVDFAGRTTQPPDVEWPTGSGQDGGWNVLSLFDGIGAGRQALKNLGVPVASYKASEIDGTAMKVAQANHPDIVQVGDVRGVNAQTVPEDLDLVMGGSPCRDLSHGKLRAGKAAQTGVAGPESRLFWEFVRVLREKKPKHFLFENVGRIEPEDMAIITKELGVEPILIDSALVSGAHRPRYYWTNIPGVGQPADRGIKLRDVLLPFDEVPEAYRRAAPESINKIPPGSTKSRLEGARGHVIRPDVQDKGPTITARIRTGSPYDIVVQDGQTRRITPVEVERLLGFPDDYTEAAGKTARLGALGLSWNVPTIEHILSHLAEPAEAAPTLTVHTGGKTRAGADRLAYNYQSRKSSVLVTDEPVGVELAVVSLAKNDPAGAREVRNIHSTTSALGVRREVEGGKGKVLLVRDIDQMKPVALRALNEALASVPEADRPLVFASSKTEGDFISGAEAFPVERDLFSEVEKANRNLTFDEQAKVRGSGIDLYEAQKDIRGPDYHASGIYDQDVAELVDAVEARGKINVVDGVSNERFTIEQRDGKWALVSRDRVLFDKGDLSDAVKALSDQIGTREFNRAANDARERAGRPILAHIEEATGNVIDDAATYAELRQLADKAADDFRLDMYRMGGTKAQADELLRSMSPDAVQAFIDSKTPRIGKKPEPDVRELFRRFSSGDWSDEHPLLQSWKTAVDADYDATLFGAESGHISTADEALEVVPGIHPALARGLSEAEDQADRAFRALVEQAPPESGADVLLRQLGPEGIRPAADVAAEGVVSRIRETLDKFDMLALDFARRRAGRDPFWAHAETEFARIRDEYKRSVSRALDEASGPEPRTLAASITSQEKLENQLADFMASSGGYSEHSAHILVRGAYQNIVDAVHSLYYWAAPGSSLDEKTSLYFSYFNDDLNEAVRRLSNTQAFREQLLDDLNANTGTVLGDPAAHGSLDEAKKAFSDAKAKHLDKVSKSRPMNEFQRLLKKAYTAILTDNWTEAKLTLDELKSKSPTNAEDWKAWITEVSEESEKKAKAPEVGRGVRTIVVEQSAEAEQGKISDQQIMDQLATMEEGEILEIAGEVETDTEQIVRLLGIPVYEKGITEVSIKELLQNSYDAVKAELKLGGIKDGEIVIDVSVKERTITVTDNGHGMSPSTVRHALLRLGGSEKEGLELDEASGGFGMAKMAFLFGVETFRVETVRDGVLTIVDSTPVLLHAKKFKVQFIPTSRPNGTMISIKIPETYINGKGESVDVRFFYSYREGEYAARDMMMVNSPIDVFMKEDGRWQNSGFERVKDERGYNAYDDEGNPLYAKKPSVGVGRTAKDTMPPFFARAEADWGYVDIYMEPSKTSRNVKVLSAGIKQFEPTIRKLSPDPWPPAVDYNVVLDVHSRVKPGDPSYPFTREREKWNPKINEDISRLYVWIAKFDHADESKEIADSFTSFKTMGEAVDRNTEQVPVVKGAVAEFKTADVRVATKKGADAAKKIDEEHEEALKKLRKDLGAGKAGEEKKGIDPSLTFDKEAPQLGALKGTVVAPLDVPLYRNATNRVFDDTPEKRAFLTDLGRLVLKTKDEFSRLPNFPPYLTRADFQKVADWAAGVTFEKNLRGVVGFIPFVGVYLNPGPRHGTSPSAVAWSLHHTMIHEMTHHLVKGHSEDFTTTIGHFYDQFEDYNLLGGLLEEFRQVVDRHWDTFNEIRRDFNEPGLEDAIGSVRGGSAAHVGPSGAEAVGGGRAPGAPGDLGAGERLGQGGLAETAGAGEGLDSAREAVEANLRRMEQEAKATPEVEPAREAAPGGPGDTKALDDLLNTDDENVLFQAKKDVLPKRRRKSPKAAAVAAELEKAGLVSTDEILKLLGDEMPEYLTGVVDYMAKQREKVLQGRLKPRDVAKTLFLTLASQGADAITVRQLREALSGMEIMQSPDGTRMVVARNYVPPGSRYGKRMVTGSKWPPRIVSDSAGNTWKERTIFRGRRGKYGSEVADATMDGWTAVRPVTSEIEFADDLTVQGLGKMIRPEDAAAAWLKTPTGQRALDAIDRGEVDLEAWMDGVAIRKAFGDDRISNLKLFDASRGKVLGMDGIAKLTQRLNDARGRFDLTEEALAQQFSDFVGEELKHLRGISIGKHGFMKHLLGFGDTPTIDAVEISVWLTGRAIPTKDMERFKLYSKVKQKMNTKLVGTAMLKMVDDKFDELIRSGQVNLRGTPVWAAKHVLHHWLWDKAKGLETTHKAIGNVLEKNQGKKPLGATFRSAATGELRIEIYPGADSSTFAHEVLGHEVYLQFPGNSKEWLVLYDTYAVNGQFGKASYERLAEDVEVYAAKSVLPRSRDSVSLKRAFGYILNALERWWERKTKGTVHGVKAEVWDVLDNWFKNRERDLAPSTKPGEVVTFHGTGTRARPVPGKLTQKVSANMPHYRGEHIRHATMTKVHDPYLAVELGVKPGDEVPVAKLYEAALRKALMEDVRLKYPTKLVPITAHTVVPASRVGLLCSKLRKIVNAATGSDYSDLARQIQVVDTPAGKEARIVFRGGETSQQAMGFRGLVRDLQEWGLDRVVMTGEGRGRLLQENADWSYITVPEYRAILEGTMDSIAGPGVRRSRVAEELPTEFLEGIVDALFRDQEWIPGGVIKEGKATGAFRSRIHSLKNRFVKQIPWENLDPVVRAIVDRANRRLARIPDVLVARIQATFRARHTGIGRFTPFGDPEVLVDLYRELVRRKPIPVTGTLYSSSGRTGERAYRAFDGIDFELFDQEQARGVGLGGLAEKGGKKKFALLADPQAWAEWIDAVDVVFRRSFSGMSDTERQALSRIHAGLVTEDDVSVIIRGLYTRRADALRKADEIIEAIEGTEGTLLTSMPAREKLDIYEWFYTGQFDRIEAKWKIHGRKPVGGSPPGTRIADRQEYLLVMLGRGMADEINLDFVTDLHDAYMLVNQEQAWKTRLAARPLGPDTLKRSDRFEKYARSLGFKTQDEINLFYKAYQYSTQNLDSVVTTRSWRHLVYDADIEELQIAEAARKGNPVGLTKDAHFGQPLHLSSNNVEKTFPDRAAADAAIQNMRNEMAAKGWDADTQTQVVKGIVPNAGDMDDWYRTVVSYANKILTYWEPTAVVTRGKRLKPDTSFGITDQVAYVEALEFLQAFGLLSGKETTHTPMVYVAPGGTEALLPAVMVDQLATTLKDSVPSANFASKGWAEKALENVGMKSGSWFQVFNNMNALIKQGMTIGLAIPNPAFLMSQLVGNVAYVYMHQGLGGLARQGLFNIRHPLLAAEVAMDMRKGMPGRVSTSCIITKTGMIYTKPEITALALDHGLDSSWIKSDFIRAADQDAQKWLSTKGRTIDTLWLGPYRRMLLDMSQMVDNMMRVSTFIDYLKQGYAPADAASIARRIILDYSDLSDFERTVLRNTILFYSYQRRNLANIWWVILHDPSKAMAQLRLANGMNKLFYDKDAQIISNDYAVGRIPVMMKRGMMPGVQGVRWILPPVGIADVLTLAANLLTANNPDSMVQLAQSMNPVTAAVMAGVTRTNPYFGRTIEDPQLNTIPPILVAYDNALFGGVLRRFFNWRMVPDLNPYDMMDPGSGFGFSYVATNTPGNAGSDLWQWYIRVLGPLGGAVHPLLGISERNIRTLNAVDRANFGIAEAIPQAFGKSKTYRSAMENLYAQFDRTPTPTEPWMLGTEVNAGMAQPRPGMPWGTKGGANIGEALALIGLTPKFDFARERIQNDVNAAINLRAEMLVKEKQLK